MNQMALDWSGKELKARGISSVLENEADEWMAEALGAVRRLASSDQEFTVDDLHPLLTKEPHHHNAIGALMATAQRNGIIRRVGWAKSARREARARVIPVYRGAAK